MKLSSYIAACYQSEHDLSLFPASASKKTFDKSTMIQVKATEYEDPLVEKAGVSQSSLVNE